MPTRTVKDVMHVGLITCPVHTPIPEVARMMIKHDISAIVVTDDAGHLAGLIARTDLVVLYGYQEQPLPRRGIPPPEKLAGWRVPTGVVL